MILCLIIHQYIKFQKGLHSAGRDRRGFTPPKTTQYTVNSTFLLNYEVQP
jgi:hypothetical protein